MWDLKRSPPIRGENGIYVEPPVAITSAPMLMRIALALACALAFAVCLRLSEVNVTQLVNGLPRLMHWLAKSWPPYTQDLGTFWLRGAETVAIATVGTTFATLFAFPLSIFIARNMTPSLVLSLPVRWLVNAFRGVDTVVFALLFVAAVGLGPFAGVLGMILHSLGVIAKLNSEAIETIPNAPLEAATMTGASRTKVVSYALLPSVLPNLASISLYVWEANVRTSTILGIVGAGGIGIEIKAAIDLLDFPKLLTLTVIVLIMVTAIDQFSAWLRRRLV
jgi:phosphonate transport system permease protein